MFQTFTLEYLGYGVNDENGPSPSTLTMERMAGPGRPGRPTG